MGTIVSIIVGLAIAAAIARKRAAATEEPLEVRNHEFAGRVLRKTHVDDDGDEIECIEFQIRGLVIGERQTWSGKIRLGAIDITENAEDPYPILCGIDDCQQPDSCVFGYLSGVNAFDEVTLIEDWTTVLMIPVDALHLAKRGPRMIRFLLGVCESGDIDKVHVMDTFDLELDLNEPGFVDMHEAQREIDQAIAQLAVIVSNSDGTFDASERRVVQHWIRKKTADENDAATVESLTNDLEKAVEEAAATGFSGDASSQISSLCTTIVRKGASANRYDALELCLDVIKADGQADEAELETINTIAKQLEVDVSRFKEMMQKALPADMLEAENPDTLLGIHDGMSPDEIRSHLMAEFAKWNGRASHTDSTVRGQATKMLAMIGEARKRHES